MTTPSPREAGRRAAQKILGDAFAVEDIADMALLLSAGSDIEAIERCSPPVHPSEDGLAGAKSMTGWSDQPMSRPMWR
jgi:hypothetical protein